LFWGGFLIGRLTPIPRGLPRGSSLFLDGVDELECTTGEEKVLADLFNGLIGRGHTVIISTRPEHFDFSRTVNTQSGKIDYNRFSLYRLHPMGREEAEKMCLRTIKRYMALNKDAIADRQKDKSPLSGKELRRYRKQLSYYLERCHRNGDFSSVLDNPMLCRYSYQIVSNSATENDTPAILTESQKREIALRAVIGWEYHDGVPTESKYVSKNSAEGREQYEKVCDFLSEIAIKASENGGKIKRDEWEYIKKQCRLDINSSLNLMEESVNGELSFAHLSLYEYFLARWLAFADRNIVSGGTLQKLCELLKQSKEFAEMYSEFTVKRSLVDSYLTSMSPEDLVNFAQGKRSSLFEECKEFTVDDILQYFPLSTVTYCGMDFDFDRMRNIKETGMLNLDSNIQYLAEKSVKWLTTHEITCVSVPREGIVTLSHKKTFSVESLYLYLTIYRQGKKMLVDSSQLISSDKVHEGLEERKDNKGIFVFREYSQNKDGVDMPGELSLIDEVILLMVNFIGNNGAYWCLFCGDSFTVCSMTEKNALLLKRIYAKNSVRDPYSYIPFYMGYLFCTKPLSGFIETIKPYNINSEDIDFTFYHDYHYERYIGINEWGFMSEYNNIWKKNRHILNKLKHKGFDGSDTQVERIQFDSANKYLNKINSPKLKCIISDEKLIHYYATKDPKLLVEEAKKTISYCEEINYGDGAAIRDSILKSEDLNKDMDRIGQLITDKLENQIWF
jgi:hypothetical protein